MILLGLLLELLSIIKIYLVISFDTKFEESSASTNEETLYKYVIGVILADSIIGLICGLFIILM